MGSFHYVLGYSPFCKSLVSLSQAQADLTSWKNSSLNFCSELYIKGTLSVSSETYPVVIMMFYWLLVIKKK